MSTKNERNRLHSIEFRVGVQQKCNDCGLTCNKTIDDGGMADHGASGSSNFLLSCQFTSVTKLGGVYVCVV